MGDGCGESKGKTVVGSRLLVSHRLCALGALCGKAMNLDSRFRGNDMPMTPFRVVRVPRRREGKISRSDDLSFLRGLDLLAGRRYGGRDCV